jgi:hypothetical protein
MRGHALHRQQLAPEKIHQRKNPFYRDHATTPGGAARIRFRHKPAVYISQMYVSTWFGTFLIKPK